MSQFLRTINPTAPCTTMPSPLATEYTAWLNAKT